MPEEIGFGFVEEVPQEPENVAQESLIEVTEQSATHEGWGGRREGSGRKKTGLKRPNRSIRATDEEYELVMQFLKTLRANKKKN